MAAITASMVGELRAKTDAPDDGMQEGPDRGRRQHGQGRRAAAHQARQQGRQGRRRASRPKAWSPPSSTATPARMIEINCETDFVTKNDSFLAMANAAADAGRQEQPGRRRRAGRAAVRAGRLRPDARRRAQGPDRQDRREHELPPLQALRRQRQAGFVPARHPHRRDGRVRRRRQPPPRTSRCTSPP